VKVRAMIGLLQSLVKELPEAAEAEIEISRLGFPGRHAVSFVVGVLVDVPMVRIVAETDTKDDLQR